jgi:hypothetical protein
MKTCSKYITDIHTISIYKFVYFPVYKKSFCHLFYQVNAIFNYHASHLFLIEKFQKNNKITRNYFR